MRNNYNKKDFIILILIILETVLLTLMLNNFEAFESVLIFSSILILVVVIGTIVALYSTFKQVKKHGFRNIFLLIISLLLSVLNIISIFTLIYYQFST